MARLPEFDAHFDEMRQNAAKEGMVLRYVGVVDVRSGEIKASLEKYVAVFTLMFLATYSLSFSISSLFLLNTDTTPFPFPFLSSFSRYPATHPFATSLGGSDNIVMFHTERYGARPLIVQGAGAGAPVTAMGVLGDLLKLVAV